MGWKESKIKPPARTSVEAVQHFLNGARKGKICLSQRAVICPPGNTSNRTEIVATCESSDCKTGFLVIQEKKSSGRIKIRVAGPVFANLGRN